MSFKSIKLRWYYFIIPLLLTTIRSIAQSEPPKYVINDYAENALTEYTYGSGSFNQRVSEKFKQDGYNQKQIDLRMKSLASDKAFREGSYEVLLQSEYDRASSISSVEGVVFRLTSLGNGMSETNAQLLAKYIIAKKEAEIKRDQLIALQKQNELLAQQKAEEEEKRRKYEEEQRLAEAKRKKEALDRFMIDRKKNIYTYENYNHAHFSNLKEKLTNSIFNFITEEEDNLRDVELNITLNIDTNSNTTNSLHKSKNIPQDLDNFLESLIQEIKLELCIDPVHKVSVNAVAQLNFKITRSLNDYSIAYLDDGIYLNNGNEANYEQDRQKIFNELKDENQAYGNYSLQYDITKVNDTSKEHINYISYSGFGGSSNALISLVAPGLGNKFVSRSKSSSWYINTIGIIGLAGGGVYYKMQSNDSYDNYKASSIQNEMDKYYEDASKKNEIAYTLLGAAAAWWVYDIINVGIKGGKNSKEKERMNKKINTLLSPSYNNGAYGMVLQLKF